MTFKKIKDWVKKIKDWYCIIVGLGAGIFGLGIMLYVLGVAQLPYAFLFLIIVIYYVYSMANQGLFYGYIQSWEWKSLWKDNSLKRVAGEHHCIVKSSLIHFMIVVPLMILVVYSLYHYKLLTFYPFGKIIWLDSTRLYAYMTSASFLPVYWYILLIFVFLFFTFVIYVLVYKIYPSYTLYSVPLDKVILEQFRKLTIRDTLLLSIFIGLLICYVLLNIPALASLYDPDDSSYKTSPIVLIGATIIAIFVFTYSTRIYWIMLFGIIAIAGIVLYFYELLNYRLEFYSIQITKIFSYLIPIAMYGTTLIIVLSIGVVVWNWIFREKEVESEAYDELNEKMKPWLGFNGRFVSESFVNGNLMTLEKLYEETHPKKKKFFYLEYFFGNILNRNVRTLLQRKNSLWLGVLFNNCNDNKHKKMDPMYPLMAWDDKGLKKRLQIKEIQETISKPRFEDPEGDVFLSMELEGKTVANTNPSLWSVFYVTGIIYLTIVPYFLVYNVVMLVIFTKFVEFLAVKEISLLNQLLYGFVGAQGLIFLGFLLSIFANNMAVWLAWRKYYRLIKEGNKEALFFSIFKQRFLYQYIYEYEKKENGEVVTNNYECGLYPTINIEIVDQVVKELSPNNYQIYNMKFPLYKRS